MSYIASFNKTKAILDEFGLSAQKKFGQNFLIDANIVNKIAQYACDLDTISVEIGPGIGSLSEFLALNSKKVYAHEIDQHLLPVLAKTLAAYDNIAIIEGDFLKVDFKKMPYFNDEIVVCANLPYYITTPILFKLIDSKLRIKKIVIMVQKEVGERFKAQVGTKDYNALSVILQSRFDIKEVAKVPRHLFYPAPKVDSAVISFEKKEAPLVIDEELVKCAFQKRRKTLYNNLKEKYTQAVISHLFNSLDLKADVRAEALDVLTFCKMSEVIKDVI